ncbi:RNA-guided endonuclease TnpB family protein, partial [Sharpea azabuensis]
MASFIVEFPLKTEKYQEDILNKRFETGRKIYNSLVNVTQKRYKEMIKTKRYRTLLSSLSESEKSDKEIWKQINDMRKQYSMSEYSFHEDVKQMQRHFKDNIDSFTQLHYGNPMT